MSTDTYRKKTPPAQAPLYVPLDKDFPGFGVNPAVFWIEQQTSYDQKQSVAQQQQQPQTEQRAWARSQTAQKPSDKTIIRRNLDENKTIQDRYKTKIRR